MNDPLSSEIAPGTVLDEKFRIERVLGQGAMGVVVAARHLRLDEDVAIKFLLPAALKNGETVTRFEREAQAAAKIRSEHVARVSDVGRLQTGAPYMVMEHLSGMDLKNYLTEKGPLPVEEAMHYILQASEALAEAHSLGIVHRDLKPANMFRITRADGSPSIKILDFGISKLQNADVSMTQTATMMGSPYYMSPEQMTSSKNVDARTDIWAMGVIVHQLLTGKVPFEGNTIAEVCAAVLSKPAPRLDETRSDIPLGLQEIVDKALEKNRENRLSNMAEFAQALAPFGKSEDVLSAERVSRVLSFKAPSSFEGAGDAAMDAPRFEPPTDREHTLEGAAHSQRPYRPPTKSGRGLLIAGAVAGVLFGTVGYFANQSPPDDGTAPPSDAANVATHPTVEALDGSPPFDSKSNAPTTPKPTVQEKLSMSEKDGATAEQRAAPTSSGSKSQTTKLDDELAPAAEAVGLPPSDGQSRRSPAVAPSVEPARHSEKNEAPSHGQETDAPPAPADPLEHYRDRR